MACVKELMHLKWKYVGAAEGNCPACKAYINRSKHSAMSIIQEDYAGDLLEDYTGDHQCQHRGIVKDMIYILLSLTSQNL